MAEKMILGWKLVEGYTDTHKLIDETGRLVGSVANCRYNGSDAAATVYDPGGRLIGYYPDPKNAKAAVEKEVARLRKKAKE